MSYRRRFSVTLCSLREAALAMVECCALASAIIALAIALDALSPHMHR